MKKKIDTRTPEERAIDHFNSTNTIRLIPEPNRFFEIGDKVYIGNLKDCIILKPLFDGRAYLIGYTNVDHNYGNPISTEDVRGVWTWLDIFKEQPEVKSFIRNEDLQLNYHQTGMSGIIGKIYHFGVDMNPEYQRGYVWSQEDKENLIDSIFNHRDIGKFVFVRLPFKENSPTYEVLDGKQRINAIKEFYEDRLLYKGLKYSEMNVRDRYFFQNYSVNIAEVQDCSLNQKLKIFYHLNVSGKIMDKEHLEKIKLKIEEK